MKRRYLWKLMSLGLAAYATVAFAGSVYVGQIVLIEQYAPGLTTGGSPLCYIAVPAASVSTKASCASVGVKYYYAWECDEPRRKNFLPLALASYSAGHKVMLQGSGQCSAHPSYENLDFFVISENP